MTILEQEILSIINETIGGQYIGKLKVINDENIWTLYLYLNQELSPIQIGCECSWNKFKEYVRKEIKNRKLEKVSYWKAIQELPSVECINCKFELNNDNEIYL